WTPLIIRDLQLGLDRFDALADNLGISRNLLAARLAHLVEGGIVARRRYQEHPPRDRYVLTEAGQELVPVLMALTAWADRWATPGGGRRGAPARGRPPGGFPPPPLRARVHPNRQLRRLRPARAPRRNRGPPRARRPHRPRHPPHGRNAR